MSVVAPKLEFTGERIVPGQTAEVLFRQHEVRYAFAAQYVKAKDVLDVACGSGIGTSFLHDIGARSVLGLDIDAGAIAFARETFPRCQFAESDATDMCLRDSSVDVVVSFETLEHLKDQSKFLAECRRVLRPGGVLICSTPNRALSCWGKPNPYHYGELSTAEFSDRLASAFSEVKLYAQGRRIYPFFVARKVILTILERLKVTKLPLSRIFRRKLTSDIKRTEFNASSNDLDDEIQPYCPQLLIQPTFLIGVGRKP
jgi:2-polyprenyl-3-methyl-5-hydroxy-6-metoxy-1,4-benzoquinol methylase